MWLIHTFVISDWLLFGCERRSTSDWTKLNRKESPLRFETDMIIREVRMVSQEVWPSSRKEWRSLEEWLNLSCFTDLLSLKSINIIFAINPLRDLLYLLVLNDLSSASAYQCVSDVLIPQSAVMTFSSRTLTYWIHSILAGHTVVPDKGCDRIVFFCLGRFLKKWNDITKCRDKSFLNCLESRQL